jgi:phthiocerol/phenolphthiocerol synthesis type-I polyketide synthase E
MAAREETSYSGIEIAIVGLAGRFPGAENVDALWRNIRDGIESVTAFTDDELRGRGIAQSALDDPAYVKAGVLLERPDRFDAGFFGYTPREAEQIDPQQRLFLECAWHALENAGYDPERLEAAVGVYAGAGANLYLMKHLLPRHAASGAGGIAELIGLLNGNAADSLCTRVAYKLNLRGPAVTVQTACSTSLAAVHMACQSLLSLECDMALAGGVWLNLLQDGGYLHQAGAILSSDGHCRAFDARADGTVLGSGAGVVVLKRLDDALRDGDTIHAVIKGSAVNNDGANKVGYTAPSVDGQANVIRTAQAVAGVRADTMGYVEAHGTGTTLGDPIEIAALTRAFRATTERRGFCAIGSVKTNVGHLDAAAGVTGLIKAVLALRHRTLPRSLNFTQPNPRIDFEDSPFYVNTVSSSWPAGDGPRRAGVSSFGMGGTNVHVVLEEAPEPVAPAPTAAAVPRAQMLVLSARTASALDAQVRALADHLAVEPAAALTDVAHTLRVGRKRHAHRAAAIARSGADAVEALHGGAAPSFFRAEILSDKPTVAFLFPGQGTQHVGMARALFEREPAFRETVEQCCSILCASAGLDLLPLIYPAAARDEDAERLSQTAVAQPALFVVEYAMAKLWMAWGVRPDAMIGHSIGEYVAACLAGVFSLEDALALVAMRGRLMQSSPPGAMLAVGLPEPSLRSWLERGCDLAAVNAEDLCVLSGAPDAIAAAERGLAADGVAVRRLHVSHAFHSARLDPILGDFKAQLRRIALHAPAIPFVSNLHGRWITAEEAQDPAYWVRHLRGTVRFADGLRTLLEKADRIPLEVGPGDTLAGLARRHLALGTKRPALSSQAHPGRPEAGAGQIDRCLAQLWTLGVDIGDAPIFDSADAARRTPLPGYPFEHESHWIDAVDPVAGSHARAGAQHEHEPADWFHVPAWRRAALAPSRPQTDAEGCTLVFDDGSSLSGRLVRRWAEEIPSPVIAIVQGDAYARLAADRYAVRPLEREDLVRALEEITAETGRPIARICHLWSLGAREAHGPQDHDFLGLLALAQALDAVPAARARGKLELTVVTDELEDLVGTEPLCPSKAMLRGPCLVIPQELPGVACRLIDVLVPAAGSVAEARLVAQLHAELRLPPGDPAVAYRGIHRWVKTFESVRWDGPAEQRLRHGGVYLITGGLGGIGLTLARHLALHWKARLVLLGREGLPARATWDALVGAHDTSPALRDRLRTVMELEQSGAEVLVVAADVAVEEELRAALALVRDRMGTVNGIVHAAGEHGGGLLADKTPEMARQVMAAKVQGTQALMSAVQGLPLDFVLLCSSLAAVAGGLGRIDYAAANAYLDAFAIAQQRSGGTPVISVGWDGWRDVGMGAKSALPEGMGITPAQGAELFVRILEGPCHPHVCISSTDLEARRREGDVMSRLASIEAAAPQRPMHARPQGLADYVAPSGDLEAGLARIWSDFLGVSPIGMDDSLFELGGDSLLAIQLLARVRQAYGVEIHPAALLRSPTVGQLAHAIETRLIEEIEAAEAPAPSSPVASTVES